jgi:hypothetical protein
MGTPSNRTHPIDPGLATRGVLLSCANIASPIILTQGLAVRGGLWGGRPRRFRQYVVHGLVVGVDAKLLNLGVADHGAARGGGLPLGFVDGSPAEPNAATELPL